MPRKPGYLLPVSLLLLALLLPATGSARVEPQTGAPCPSLASIRAQDDGGDSMGSPPRGRDRGALDRPARLAGGDSAGSAPRKGRRG